MSTLPPPPTPGGGTPSDPSPFPPPAAGSAVTGWASGAAPVPPPAAASGTATGPNPGAILLLAAGVFSVLAWLGPWFTLSFAGLASDASVGRDEYGALWGVLIVGLVVGGMAVGFLTRPAPQGLRVAAAITAGLLVAVYLFQATDWISDYSDVGDFADPGWAALISPIIPVTAVLGAIFFRSVPSSRSGTPTPVAGWGTPDLPSAPSPGPPPPPPPGFS